MATIPLDTAFKGAPIAVHGTTTGLNVAYLGAPIEVVTPGAPSSVSGSGTTAQAQTTSGAGTVGISGTGDTSQAQTVSGDGDVVAPGMTTAQAQTTDGTGTVGISGTGDTAQAQTTAGTGTVGISGTGDTAQAQTTSGTAEAINLWTIVNSAIDLQDDPDGNNSANYSFTGNKLLPGLGTTTTGNGIVVLVCGNWRTNDDPTITVTDNAGNTYTPGTLFKQTSGITPSVHTRPWMQAFYCANATGHANLIPQFDVVQGGAATVFDLPSRMSIAAFEVQSDLAIELDVEEFAHTSSGSTSITSDAFTTTAAGAIFTLQYNFGEDSVASSTVNFESDYTDLTRPGRLASTGFPDNTYSAAGYRITSGPITGEQVTFTGSTSTNRAILAVGFKQVAGTVEGDGTTAQAQTSLGFGGVGWSAAGDTAQAQTTDGAGTVQNVTYVALTGVQTTGAAGNVAARASAGVSGVSASGATGSVGRADRRVALTGTQAAGTVGSVTLGARPVALTGVVATGAVGNVTTSRTRSITGVSSTGVVATIGAVLKPPLTGVSATGATGTVTPPSGLSGTQATGHVGTVALRVSKALTGVAATGEVGTLGTTTSTRLSGISSTGSVGSVGVERDHQLSGVAGATTVGNVLPSQGTTGVAASGAVGGVGQRRVIALTGVQANTAVGTVGNVQPVNSDSVFVSQRTDRVTTAPVAANVFIVSSAVQVAVNTKDEQVLV